MFVLFEIVWLFVYLLYSIIECVVRTFIPPKKKSFSGKVVLVTGAGHGIGRELALQFSAIGARLVLWDINKDNADNVAREITEQGGVASVYWCDVSKLEHVKGVASKVLRDVGDIDVLVNNAGVLNGGEFLELSEDDIRRTVDINMMAYMWTCRQFLPAMLMKNSGHMVNIISMAAKTGSAYLTDYCASKHGANGFYLSLESELKRKGVDGIRITNVYPMFVQTGLLINRRERFGRWLTPEEVAAAAIEGAQRNQRFVFVPSTMGPMMKLAGVFPDKFLQRLDTFLDAGCDPQYKKSH